MAIAVEKVKNNKKKIFAVLIGLLAIALLLSAFTQIGGGNNQEAAETLYRESTVQRGDITVGVSETSTATLKTHALSFDVSAGIDEIFVKAGQPVRKGDIIATITTDNIEDQIKSLQADYKDAALKLSEAQLSQQKGTVNAKSDLNSTLNRANTADLTYEQTVEKLEQTIVNRQNTITSRENNVISRENALAKAKDNVAEIQSEIRTYTNLLRYVDGYYDDYYEYSSAKAWYEDAQKWVQDVEKQISDYKKRDDFNENDATYQNLLSNLARAREELTYAKLEYDNAAKDYNRKYDTNLTDEDDIRDARDEAYKRLTDAEASVKEAEASLAEAKSSVQEAEASLRESELDLEIQTSQATLTRDDNTSRAATANTTYNLELQSLANTVASRQLALDNIQEQIDEQTALLDDNTIYAPCDGTVISVSKSDGGSVMPGETVVTVSDHDNVFVYLSVTQDDITGVSFGQSCTVDMDAFETITFMGIVDSITTTPVRSATGGASYSVTVKLEGDTAQIYEGMTGTTTLITRQQKDVLHVTNRTIYARDGQSYVKVKNVDGEIEEVAVTTGFSDGRNVEITSGLTEGQIVIIESQVAAQR